MELITKETKVLNSFRASPNKVPCGAGIEPSISGLVDEWSTTVQLLQACTANTFILPYFGGDGWTRTLNLGMMSRVFYLCAISVKRQL
jgi:hypothetical protein